MRRAEVHVQLQIVDAQRSVAADLLRYYVRWADHQVFFDLCWSKVRVIRNDRPRINLAVRVGEIEEASMAAQSMLRTNSSVCCRLSVPAKAMISMDSLTSDWSPANRARPSLKLLACAMDFSNGSRSGVVCTEKAAPSTIIHRFRRCPRRTISACAAVALDAA